MNPGCLPLASCLLGAVQGRSERAAFFTDGGVLTYGAFAGMVSAGAARLRRLGLRTGDRVVLCGPATPAWAAAYFAIHAAGCVAVPLDADMHPSGVQQIIESSEPSCALVAAGKDWPVACHDLAAICEPMRGLPDVEPACQADDVADLLFTTGTTGRKKGVVLTHRQIAQAATNINAFVQNNADDVELLPLPLSHSFGLGRLRSMAQTGNAVLLQPGLRNPAKVLKAAAELKITGLALVPAGFDILFRMTGDRLGAARSHLRYIEIGSAAMSLESKHRLMALLPQTRICHHYGLTEASRAAFLEYHAESQRLDSIGRASPNVRIEVRDDQDRVAPPNECGELVVCGGMVMKEYWRQPDLTRAALRDGWLRTGDWGYRDREGYLYLAGRHSDLINVAGMKISPEEIEQALDAHPAIVESACIGMPDPNGVTGECVKACIVVRSDVTDGQLVDWLRKRIEEYKIPRLWQRVEKIARTSSGKIQRHLARQATSE
jgi:long-chain acyl-CoA synthetase